MEHKFRAILCILWLAVTYVGCEHSQVVDLVAKTVAQISENVVHLVVDCEEYNLRRTIGTLHEVENKISKSHVNVIIEPVNNKIARPSIFAKSFSQLLDALENHACIEKMSYDGWELSAKMQSILRRTIEQAHSQDAIFAFIATEPEEWKETFKETARVPINFIWTGSTKVPEIFTDIAARTKGQILADNNARTPQMEEIRQRNVQSNDTSNYRISMLTHSLNGNTRTEMQLPEQTFRIFLTIRGQVQKALLIPQSGVVINITPERTQTTSDQISQSGMQIPSIFYDTLVKNSPETWTLVADGNQYDVSMLMLTTKRNNEDDSVLQYRSYDPSFDAFKTNEQLSARKHDTNDAMQLSYDASALTRRQDIPEALPFPSRQRPNTILNSLAADSLTKIDVSLLSTFYAFPGEEVRIIFNVENLKPIAFVHEFKCFYQQQPCFLQPMYANLLPEQRIQVIATVRAEGSEGSSNIVAFISQSMDIADRKVYLYIGKQKSDNTKPDIDYEYNGNCDDANTGSTCNQKKWTASLWAQDSDSGLLNFWSEPPGLIYTTEFIVGTKDRVSARYAASCCNPKADILATDLRGNIYKITLNIERLYFSALEITAMVLAVILLILVIAAIIYAFIRWRRRKNERAFLG